MAWNLSLMPLFLYVGRHTEDSAYISLHINRYHPRSLWISSGNVLRILLSVVHCVTVIQQPLLDFVVCRIENAGVGWPVEQLIT